MWAVYSVLISVLIRSAVKSALGQKPFRTKSFKSTLRVYVRESYGSFCQAGVPRTIMLGLHSSNPPWKGGCTFGLWGLKSEGRVLENLEIRGPLFRPGHLIFQGGGGWNLIKEMHPPGFEKYHISCDHVALSKYLTYRISYLQRYQVNHWSSAYCDPTHQNIAWTTLNVLISSSRCSVHCPPYGESSALPSPTLVSGSRFPVNNYSNVKNSISLDNET